MHALLIPVVTGWSILAAGLVAYVGLHLGHRRPR